MPTSPGPIPDFDGATEFSIQSLRRIGGDAPDFVFMCNALPMFDLVRYRGERLDVSVRYSMFVRTLTYGRDEDCDPGRFHRWVRTIFPSAKVDGNGVRMSHEDAVLMKLMAE